MSRQREKQQQQQQKAEERTNASITFCSFIFSSFPSHDSIEQQDKHFSSLNQHIFTYIYTIQHSTCTYIFTLLLSGRILSGWFGHIIIFALPFPLSVFARHLFTYKHTHTHTLNVTISIARAFI